MSLKNNSKWPLIGESSEIVYKPYVFETIVFQYSKSLHIVEAKDATAEIVWKEILSTLGVLCSIL